MQFPDIIKNLPTLTIPLNGAEANLFQGTQNQLVFFDFKEDSEIPMHAHRAQWGIVVDGGKIHAGFKAIDFFEEPDRY